MLILLWNASIIKESVLIGFTIIYFITMYSHGFLYTYNLTTM